MKIQTIDEYIDLLAPNQKEYAIVLRRLVNESVPEAKEMIFVSHPAFYIPIKGETSFHKMPMIMMIFFNDHVNIFASGIEVYQNDLKEYRMTKKYTLQIYFDMPINHEILRLVFKNSLQSGQNLDRNIFFYVSMNMDK